MPTLSNPEIREITESITQELKNLINNRFDKLEERLDRVEQRLEKVEKQFNGVEIRMARIEGELTGVNKRLDSLDFTNRTIYVAVIGALFAGLFKLFFPNIPSNP